MENMMRFRKTLSCDMGLKLQMFNKSFPETAADTSSDGI